MNYHKLYLPIIAAVVLIAVLVGFAWTAHVRDEAQRDAVIKVQEETISNLKSEMAKNAAELKQQLSDLAAKKQQVIQTPAQAPQIIREYLPTSTPIQQTAPITKETLPDAPVAVLTRQNEQDLAQFALKCKECDTKLASAQQDAELQIQQVAALTKERDAAIKASKGGSVWQRTKRNAKWLLVGGIIGYAASKGH